MKKIYNSIKNETIGVFSPDHTRTFCYIEDAVNQIYKLTTNKTVRNEIFNLGTQTPEIKMKDLALKIIKIMGREDLIIKELENTPGSPERRCPLTHKLDKTTDKEDRTSLDEGLKNTYQWYLS